ncbi:MAG: type II toxin-antitoxin system HicB family antitoxin [Methylovulum sp.]|nr:type II toxin-antitoxin system HicB family antitoxin [Methylovulum sp.]
MGEFFYGKQEEECNRELIRKKQSGWSAINPTLAFFGKDAFDILDKYVDFSLPVRCYFTGKKNDKIKAQIREGEQSGFVAECVDLPFVTQGLTLDEVTLNIRKAIALHLEGEDLAILGFTPNPQLIINYEVPARVL